MTHPQVFGQKFTPIRRFLAWKTHPFWPHIPNIAQYGSATPRLNSFSFRFSSSVMIGKLFDFTEFLSFLAEPPYVGPLGDEIFEKELHFVDFLILTLLRKS